MNDLTITHDSGKIEGYAEYKICQVKEGYRLLARGYNGLPFDVDFYISQNEITELKNLVSLLNWEEEYKCEGKICDGYGWRLKGWEIESSGYEAFPKDFETVKFVVQMTFERLRKEYDSSAKKRGADANTIKIDLLECLREES